MVGWMKGLRARVSYFQPSCHGIKVWILRPECDMGFLMYDSETLLCFE
jgi:hypothetical protein